MRSKSIFLLTVSLLFLQTAIAQERRGRPENFEQFQAMKVAFITETLELTSEEAEKFWPVYNEYSEKKQEIRQQQRKEHHDFMSDAENISEEEALKILDNHLSMRKKDLELDVKYDMKFREVLSAKKVMLLYLSEMQFKSFLLKQIRNHEGEGKKYGGRGNQWPGPELPY